MEPSLERLASDFATGLRVADALKPQAVSPRSKRTYAAGIGPHTEAEAVGLVFGALLLRADSPYKDRIAFQVPYPSASRSRCDFCIGVSPNWEWNVEVKLLRLLGDNGKPNDNMLLHVLSPYPFHRSALTDCEKLRQSGLHGHKAILIYGFDHPRWPMDPAIDAFEQLARLRVQLSDRLAVPFSGLIHPVHREGRVFAWEVS